AALCGETRTNTSERGSIFGSKAAINDFKQYQLSYIHSDFFGGTLTVNAYKADQEMRYLPENTIDKQDPLIAPMDTIYDQSEIVTNKKGLRTSWARPSLFSVSGLELRVGLDLVKDTAQQRLALTNRLWVPPMEYSSKAPWAQLSWDIGPVTLSGGLRREDGELHVDSYTTTWYRDRRHVDGGTLEYQETLKNLGAVWRINDAWSVFGSYGEGFTLANVGIPLRNIQCSNDPGDTQPDGCPNDPRIGVGDLLDLNAIVVKNTEFGFNWRGERGALSASHYDSKSDYGQSLAIDPATNDFVLLRAPVRIGVLAHRRQDFVLGRRRGRTLSRRRHQQADGRARHQPRQVRLDPDLELSAARRHEPGRDHAVLAQPVGQRRARLRRPAFQLQGKHPRLHLVRPGHELRNRALRQVLARHREPVRQAIHPELVAAAGRLPELLGRTRPHRVAHPYLQVLTTRREWLAPTAFLQTTDCAQARRRLSLEPRRRRFLPESPRTQNVW
ncbi:MAG: TonB-dependent receptor, partial [Lysobacter sp.]|nr:TonB-dependent receptor [Lysobacter sp.]